MAALMLGLLLVAFVFCVVIGGLFWAIGPNREGRPRHLFVPILALFFLSGLFFIAARGFQSLRQNAQALDEVMTNVNRIAGGEYDVRTTERGWTETRELARSVDVMAARLRTAESRRIALQADIAHELRTPLSVIQGTTEGMLDGVYARDDEHLELVLRRSRMMTDLLEDFRTIATAEAGRLQLQRERLDLAELLDGIAVDFRAEAGRKAVSVERTGVSPLDVELDPVRIAEVVDNLMKNAVRHTNPGGRVELGADALTGSVRIWVRDTGNGIPPEQLGGIFDRYAKSADSGGSGLGLAIARRLVEAHGGTISVTSEIGVGTTFTIELPQA
jgi:signal transduction histidine kinase